jgi:phospho-N-acetylmuramoyl-pentapeptide-transferase
MLIAFGIALVVSFVAGLIIIPILRKFKAGQMIREDGPTWHASKSGTPTMGGFIFIIGIVAAILIAGAGNIAKGDYTHLYILAFGIIFGAIGFADDLAKLRHKQNEGLSAMQKLLMQIAASVAFVLLMRFTGQVTMNLYIPFTHLSIPLPEPVYLVLAAFAIVAEVNAVNLTDGVDGLASGVTVPVAVFFAVLAYAWNAKSGGEVYSAAGIFAAALTGGLIGFLIFNFHPAKVFMGDTGSLFLGGAVCALAFAFDMPLILLVVGFVYLCETLSDVIQVLVFKISRKITGTPKRVFKMAPLHHHFELCGWSEKKLFAVFTTVSIIAAVAAYFAVRSRWH